MRVTWRQTLSAAAVGVAHHDVAAGAGVAFASRCSTPSPCRWWPGRGSGSPGRSRRGRCPARRVTGPIAFSTSAGSASVLSPYCARGRPAGRRCRGPRVRPLARSADGRCRCRRAVPPPPMASTATTTIAELDASHGPPPLSRWPAGHRGSLGPAGQAPPFSYVFRRPPDADGSSVARPAASARAARAPRPDDAVARHQHPADDHEPEHHELQRRGQAHDPHHLVEPRQEERRRPRRQRARQPARERRAADHDGGDRAEEVRGCRS